MSFCRKQKPSRVLRLKISAPIKCSRILINLKLKVLLIILSVSAADRIYAVLFTDELFTRQFPRSLFQTVHVYVLCRSYFEKRDFFLFRKLPQYRASRLSERSFKL